MLTPAQVSLLHEAAEYLRRPGLWPAEALAECAGRLLQLAGGDRPSELLELRRLQQAEARDADNYLRSPKGTAARIAELKSALGLGD